MDSKGIEVTRESVVQGLVALGYDEAQVKEAARRAFKDAAVMKFGTSCASHEIVEALKCFDYVEVWDQPVQGHAYHIKAGDFMGMSDILKHPPYVVVHTDSAPPGPMPGLMVENIPGEQAEHVARSLNGNDFLLDVGHAFSANRYPESGVKDQYDFDRWFALKPKALHFHDCRIDEPNPWGKPDAADHQMLGLGVLPLRALLQRAIKEGVLYCTLECFFDGFGQGRTYSFKEKREALDVLMM